MNEIIWQNEVLEMAKQAGCFEKYQVFYLTKLELEAFVELVAAKEREACARVVEASISAEHAAANIRARGEA